MKNHGLFELNVSEKTLSNGMKIVVRPTHKIPRVDAQIWYQVGSKHEGTNEKGMAHLIEHMLFKGTQRLSESDINMITHKLSGYTNAFTSHDATCFVFRFPSNCWQIALDLFADCMENARFDTQMLWSEVKTVIEELRMYKDDYQNMVIQSLLSSIFAEHPYHYPIIGSKQDLAKLDRNALFSFYKKHYHPANATLVVIGDICPDDVFKKAEELFGHIQSPSISSKTNIVIEDDIAHKSVTLYREVTTAWSCYMYVVPGLQDLQGHLIDIASLILGSGRSSRLYKRLVEQEQIAADVESFSLDFFESGIFGITVYPLKEGQFSKIESIIEDEIEKLRTAPIEDWEFQASRKKVLIDYASLIESSEKQATVLGNIILATGDSRNIKNYFEKIENLTKQELQDFFSQYLSPSRQHKGYLLPINQKDLPKLQEIQKKSDLFEESILEKHQRTTEIEPARLTDSISVPQLQKFDYPQPQEFSLQNGLNILFHHNDQVPYIVGVLTFKASPLYDSVDRQGCFNFLLQIMTDRTKKYSCDEFHKILESNGISLDASSESITIRSLSQDIGQTLHLLGELLTEPSFDEPTIEKIRQQLLNEVSEYWDNPTEFINQLARQKIYAKHPYAKNSIGSKESLESITVNDLQECFNNFISPQGATLTLVGDLSNYDIAQIIEERLGKWKGKTVEQLQFPEITPPQPEIISHPINRDQIVLAFVTPTISRSDKNYLHYALLDIILTGGSSGSMSSRLFALREQSGLFYTIGGSLIHGAREEPGMMLIKTIVAADKSDKAQELILQTIEDLGKNGITNDEFIMAKNIALSSLVELFETNIHMVYTFSFIKKYNLSFNLFDKQLEALSIIKIEDVNHIAQKICNKKIISTIQVGRVR